jgi:uncharacterized membrane protein
MKTLFGIAGVVVGAWLAEFPGAIVGLLLGVVVGMLLKRASTASSAPEVRAATPPPLSLQARVTQLEQQVQALRAEVTRLSELAGVAVTPVSADAASAPAESIQPPPAVMPVPAPVPEPVVEPVVAMAATPARASVAAPVAPVAAAPAAPSPAMPPAAPRPPAPPLKDRLPPYLREWIFGGNTIVKVGVLVLFLGLAFLLRYAAERVTVPPELRYAGVALAGIALLALGWRLRGRRDAAGGTGYGLILQGAGIGVLYLTTLASLKLHGLIPPEAAFAFLLAVTVLSAVLAVAQDAPWLAYVSAAEGFAAPVLVSTGGGHHHVLFGYLALLDIGVFLIAWFKAWRPLNLVAFVGTFTLAGAWAKGHYDEALYAGVQSWLLLFFVLFTAIGVLFARRALALGRLPDESDPLARRAAEALAQVGRVDSALVFGVPLVAYGLQYLLVKNWADGPAWAALGFAFVYLLLGGVTMRRGAPRYALLGEAYVIVAVIFGTLAIPLALEGEWTGATWAIEAAGMYWLGTRQHRAYARAFALLVLAMAALRTASALGVDESVGTPLLTGSALGMGLLAVGALAMHAVSVRSGQRSGASIAAWEQVGQAGTLGIGLAALAAIAWLLLAPRWACVATSALALGVALAPARWRSPALPWSVAALQTLALCGFIATLHVLHGQAMLDSGWAGVVAALLIAASLLATAWLAIPMAVRERLRGAGDPSGEAAAWPLGATLGLLAGMGAIGASALFVLPADEAARVWPWLGVAALWAGVRLRHPPLAISGAVWQAIAGGAWLAFAESPWSLSVTGMSLLTPLVITLAGLMSGDMLHSASRRGASPDAPRALALQWLAVGWALLWWTQVLPPELWRGLQRQVTDWPGWWASVLGGWILLSSLGLALLARWRDWSVPGQATWATLPAWAMVAWLQLVLLDEAPHGHGGWLLWPLALAWHAVLLTWQARWAPARARVPLHVAGFWLFIVLAARELQFALAQVGAPGSAWAALGWVVVPALALAALARPAVQRRWPVAEFREAYLLWAAAPVAAYLLLWVWLSNGLPGDAAPLPDVPLLNPLEMGHVLVLLALLSWWRGLPAAGRRWMPAPVAIAALGLTGFALYTGAVLRACHHLAGVPWQGSALFASTLAQASLSVAWALLGVALMVLGHRRLHRVVWGAGAGLLAVVVLKLFFIELADHGGLYRIVSFIVVGLLLLLVGYFAPVPPRRAEPAAGEVA